MRLQEFLSEGIEDKGILKAAFMAGSPGSGKSYTLSKIKSGSIEPRMVNTDRAYPLFKKEWSEGWGKIKDTVKRISANQLALYINSLLPLAVDGTGLTPSIVFRRIGILESFGYDCGMVFINTSLETALERASKRERPVDPKFIEDAYNRIKEAKNFYRTKFQTFIEVNNDKGELDDKVVVDAFKFMRKFYLSQIINPIGRDTIKTMRENNWKYLDDGIKDLNTTKGIVSGWYNW